MRFRVPLFPTHGHSRRGVLRVLEGPTDQDEEPLFPRRPLSLFSTWSVFRSVRKPGGSLGSVPYRHSVLLVLLLIPPYRTYVTHPCLPTPTRDEQRPSVPPASGHPSRPGRRHPRHHDDLLVSASRRDDFSEDKYHRSLERDLVLPADPVEEYLTFDVPTPPPCPRLYLPASGFRDSEWVQSDYVLRDIGCVSSFLT